MAALRDRRQSNDLKGSEPTRGNGQGGGNKTLHHWHRQTEFFEGTDIV